MRHRKLLCVLGKDACLVMVLGGGQTSSQVPDGGGHCGVSVEFP